MPVLKRGKEGSCPALRDNEVDLAPRDWSLSSPPIGGYLVAGYNTENF